jgi:hypothetical protein
VTSMSERTVSQAERIVGLSARVGENRRDLKEVALVMLDGTEIRGVMHRTPGTRTLDFLNRQTEIFVAMTDATLTTGERHEKVSFVAINKAHIVRVLETTDTD